MLKIILSGCHGKMGKVLQSMIVAKEEMMVVAGIDQNTDLPSDFPVYAQLAQVQETADVVIDFSHFSTVTQLVNDAKALHLPVVVATTGLTPDIQATINQASEEIAIFQSANMSLGINVLIKALQAVTPIL
ncbi:4-hydroxy-tetrahydrodipicolinate reductase, partial [Enterococcus cecorum]|nr:4-hydroxy-tetrahydrodipicolinate reductase [Enterococcus cecorum]